MIPTTATTCPSHAKFGRAAAQQRASTASPCAVKSSAKSAPLSLIFTDRSQHLSLLRPRYHIDLLDRYADLLDARAGLAQMVAELTSVQAQMRGLQDDREALQRRADLLRHELEEITAAELDPAEEAALLADRNRLANGEQLAQLAAQAALLLNGDESGARAAAVDSLMGVSAALQKLARIDPVMTGDYELAENLAQQAQELALNLARYADEVEFDPYRLDELEERLELIKTLKRRYRVDSIKAILAYGARTAAELATIEHSDERLEALRISEARLLRSIGDICARLSKARASAGRDLSAAVVRELATCAWSGRNSKCRWHKRTSGGLHRRRQALQI